MKNNRTTYIAVGLAWLLSLGIVFVLGILSAFTFHVQPGNTGSLSGDLNLDEREMGLVIERYTGQPADFTSLRSSLDRDKLPDQLEQAVRSILRESRTTARVRNLREVAEGLSTGKITALLQWAGSLPEGPARRDALSVLLEAWASRDGRSALAFARQLVRRMEDSFTVEAVLRGWATQRPEDSWDWVGKQDVSRRTRIDWYDAILQSLQNRSLEDTFVQLRVLDEGVVRSSLTQKVFNRLLENYPTEDVLRWLSEAPEPALPEIRVLIAEHWILQSPGSAVAWFSQFAEDQPDDLVYLVGLWAEQDPETAVNWVVDEVPQELRREVLGDVAAAWIERSGPTPLAEWLNAQGPSRELDLAISELAMRTAEFDPGTALVWAQSVSSGDLLESLELEIGENWISRNPDNAFNELSQLLQSPRAREYFLGSANNEPEPVEESSEEEGNSEE